MIDLIKMGLRNLGRRKARTALTVIGVVIGTISIVIMVSIGIGMNENYTKQVMELGSLTTITVSKYQDVMDKDGNYVDYKEQVLNAELAEQIKHIDHVKAVSPAIDAQVEFIAGKYHCSTNISVMDSAEFEAFDFPSLSYGTYELEEGSSSPTVWFGQNVLSYWFYNPNSRYYENHEVDPSDKIKIKISDWELQLPEGKKPREYTVNVGVFDAADGSDFCYNVYMDKAEYEKIFREYMKSLETSKKKKAEKKLSEYSTIRVCVDNVKNIEEVRDAIKDLGFYSSSLTDYTKSSEETSKMLQMVLGGVGAVSMLVSAISIANTMVMSIYERTKEIGVMKVLGCLVRDIKKLFLFEAAMIGLIGGLIGIFISYILSFLINRFGGKLFETIMSTGSLWGQTGDTNFSIIPLWLPVAAALFAMGVGILSGYAPANKATKISAIEAMKNE